MCMHLVVYFYVYLVEVCYVGENNKFLFYDSNLLSNCMIRHGSEVRFAISFTSLIIAGKVTPTLKNKFVAPNT